MDTDLELWSRAAGGDGGAFGTLFDRHARSVYNHCFRRTADWSAAEDLTSVVFLEAWRRRRQVRISSDSLLPWLLGVANREAVPQVRRLVRAHVHLRAAWGGCGKVWRKLLRDADRSPIPVTSAQFGKGKLTGFHLQVAVGLSAADPGAFAKAVDKARHGDGSAFADNVLGLLAVYTQPIVLALRCPDGLGYTTYAEHREALREARRISPDMPYSAFDGLVCFGWKIPVANPARPLPVKGLPPFLGAGSQSDFPWTDSLTRTIPGSTSVLYDGPGHVMYLTGSTCVVEHADRYLTELKLPPAGTVCRA